MGYGRKSAVEDYWALDVRHLARSGSLKAGHNCRWCWGRDSEKVASIGIKAEAHAIHLTYSANGKLQDYSVQLVRTPCHYGGNRVWFICPAIGCNRRVAKLYGGSIFACRHCHQLNYASQQWSKPDRASNTSLRLRYKMGCTLSWIDFPAELIPRVKGRHRKTHARYIARLKRYDGAARAELLRLIWLTDAI